MRDYADKRWLLQPPTAAQRIALRAAALRAEWGARLACHPRSTFVYTPAAHTDVRATLRAAGLGV
jgi:hypothetical protein